VVGGTTIAALQEAYPSVPVFRLIPNTPVEVRHGVVCYAPTPGVAQGLERDVLALFERLGTVVQVDESLIGAAAAVSGVAPAYQALLERNGVRTAFQSAMDAVIDGGSR
jgi:pyrroline-5-carboxylate reductase